MSTSCQSIEGFWLIAGVFLLLWVMPTCSLEHDFHLLSVQEKISSLNKLLYRSRKSCLYFLHPTICSFQLSCGSPCHRDNTDTKSFYGFWKMLHKLMGSVVLSPLHLAMVLRTEAWYRLLYLFCQSWLKTFWIPDLIQNMHMTIFLSLPHTMACIEAPVESVAVKFTARASHLATIKTDHSVWWQREKSNRNVADTSR